MQKLTYWNQPYPRNAEHLADVQQELRRLAELEEASKPTPAPMPAIPANYYIAKSAAPGGYWTPDGVYHAE